MAQCSPYCVPVHAFKQGRHMISVRQSSNNAAKLSLGNGVYMEFTLEMGKETVDKIVDGLITKRFMRKHEKIHVPPHTLRRARYAALCAILSHRRGLTRILVKKREVQLVFSLK